MQKNYMQRKFSKQSSIRKPDTVPGGGDQVAQGLVLQQTNHVPKKKKKKIGL